MADFYPVFNSGLSLGSAVVDPPVPSEEPLHSVDQLGTVGGISYVISEQIGAWHVAFVVSKATVAPVVVVYLNEYK